VIGLCTKILIIKLLFIIVQIIVGHGYMEGIEFQGPRKCCYQNFQD